MIVTESAMVPEAKRQFRIFRKSLPMQIRLHEVLRLLDTLEGAMCLDVGAGNGMISYYLRKRGGVWHSLVAAEHVASVTALAPDNVGSYAGGPLPFEDKVFDVIVVMELLERLASDEAFIAECHRVLKPDGRLIVNVPHHKNWSALRAIKKLLGMAAERRGLARSGYSESELFRVLKHGFDVYQMKSYSRFFVELTDTLVQFLVRESPEHRPHDVGRIPNAYRIGSLVYKLAFQLDMLLFFTRGHYLIALAKRRAWRPRQAPVLVDGRSISEVVLSKAAN